MVSFVRNALGVAVLACLGSAAHAEVLTFEDRPNFTSFFTADYQGFRFGTNNIQTTAWFSTNETSPFYRPKSGTHFLSTDFQLYPAPPQPLTPTQSITRSTDFTFDGAWFSGFEPIQYQLYNNGQLVHTSIASPDLTNVPVFISSGYTGMVDEVVILGTQGYYAMDDFTFNSAPIPEPGTYGMLAAGLVGIGALMRRRQRG